MSTKDKKVLAMDNNRISEDSLSENWHFFLYQTFARLKNKFMERGISQDELAARLGKDKAFVSRCLQGHNNMTLKTMFNIARALDQRMEVKFIDLNSLAPVNRKQIEHTKPSMNYRAAQPATPIANRLNSFRIETPSAGSAQS